MAEVTLQKIISESEHQFLTRLGAEDRWYYMNATMQDLEENAKIILRKRRLNVKYRLKREGNTYYLTGRYYPYKTQR